MQSSRDDQKSQVSVSVGFWCCDMRIIPGDSKTEDLDCMASLLCQGGHHAIVVFFSNYCGKVESRSALEKTERCTQQ